MELAAILFKVLEITVSSWKYIHPEIERESEWVCVLNQIDSLFGVYGYIS